MPASQGQPCRDGDDHDREQADQEPDLTVAQGVALSLEQPQVEHERHGPREHEQGRDPVQGGTVPARHRDVGGGEPSRRDGRQRVRERLERRHRHQPVGKRASHGERHIDQDDAGRDLAHARHDLLGAVGGLRPEQLHAADAEGGQDRDRHADDADAAQPLQQRPPQQDAVRSVVEADDHGGAGRRQARHGLEEGVGEMVPQLGVVGDVERKGPEQSDGRPGDRREEKGLAQGQAAGQPAAGRMGQCRRRRRR